MKHLQQHENLNFSDCEKTTQKSTKTLAAGTTKIHLPSPQLCEIIKLFPTLPPKPHFIATHFFFSRKVLFLSCVATALT